MRCVYFSVGWTLCLFRLIIRQQRCNKKRKDLPGQSQNKGCTTALGKKNKSRIQRENFPLHISIFLSHTYIPLDLDSIRSNLKLTVIYLWVEDISVLLFLVNITVCYNTVICVRIIPKQKGCCSFYICRTLDGTFVCITVQMTAACGLQ